MLKDGDLKNWHQSLSQVEPLIKLIHRRQKQKNVNYHEISCRHSYQDGDIVWRSGVSVTVDDDNDKTTVCHLCDKCATMLRFGECIRKYVLETEHSEVTGYTWPWCRNSFHREDSYYQKFIAKYNLSRLFTTRDVIPDYGMDHDMEYKQEIKTFLETLGFQKYFDRIVNGEGNKSAEVSGEEPDEEPGVKNLAELMQKTSKKSMFLRDLGIVDRDNKEIREALAKKKDPEGQIRNLRKFAASVLLGPVDISRNLNIMRNQCYTLFNAMSDPDSGFDSDPEDSAKFPSEWEEKGGWKEMIERANTALREQLEHPKKDRLMELIPDNDFLGGDEDEVWQEKLLLVQSLMRAILKYDSMHQEMDNSENTEDSPQRGEDETRWFRQFRESFRKTPDWFVICSTF